MKREALEHEIRAEIQEAIRDYRRLLSEANFATTNGALNLTAPSAVRDVASQAGSITALGGLIAGSALLTALGLAVSAVFVAEDAFVKRRAAGKSNEYQYLLELKKLLQ